MGLQVGRQKGPNGAGCLGGTPELLALVLTNTTSTEWFTIPMNYVCRESIVTYCTPVDSDIYTGGDVTRWEVTWRRLLVGNGL